MRRVRTAASHRVDVSPELIDGHASRAVAAHALQARLSEGTDCITRGGRSGFQAQPAMEQAGHSAESFSIEMDAPSTSSEAVAIASACEGNRAWRTA
jgi:hypothetical protein